MFMWKFKMCPLVFIYIDALSLMFIQQLIQHIQWFVIFVGCPTLQNNVAPAIAVTSYPKWCHIVKHRGFHLFPHHPWVPDISQDIPSHVNPSWQTSGALKNQRTPRSSKNPNDAIKAGRRISFSVASKPGIPTQPASLVGRSVTGFAHLVDWRVQKMSCVCGQRALVLKPRIHTMTSRTSIGAIFFQCKKKHETLPHKRVLTRQNNLGWTGANVDSSDLNR